MKIVKLSTNEFSKVFSFIKEVDNDFIPSLSERSDLKSYSDKLLNELLLGIFEDNNIIGLIGSKQEQTEASIIFLAVSKKLRSKGIGKLLIKETISELRKANVKKIIIRTWPNNFSALNLYKNYGFKEYKYAKDLIDSNKDRIYLEYILD